MSRITVDESLHTKLKALSEPAEICDTSGRRLGWYCPSPAKPLPFSPREELERIRQDPSHTEGRTTEELLQWLEQQAPTQSKP
jgi:hypothetical protein